MKPVIKKQIYYSVLIMRDDTSVRTMRVRGSVITFFLAFSLFLLTGGGIGIWGGLHYWEKYGALSERHQQQERELSEARLQLERYVNYDTLLEAANETVPLLAKNEEIRAISPVLRLQNSTQVPLLPAQNGTQLVAVLPGMAASNATLAQINATMPAPDAVLIDQEPQPPPIPLISSGPLRINGFNARIGSQQRLRVRYELSTVPSDELKFISGTAKYSVISNDKEVDLPADFGDTRFSISRMKLMEVHLRLPQGVVAKDINQLYVFLDLDDGQTYKEAYPLSR